MSSRLLDAHQLCESLLQSLHERRKLSGYTQAELAEKSSVSRQTVMRAEALNPSVLLINFVQMASILGLSLNLNSKGQADSLVENFEDKPGAKLVHQGFYPLRANPEGQYADQRREAALSFLWSQENDVNKHLLEDLLNPAIHTTTQEHASVAATIIQWLGSEVGFNFLKEALNKSGYEIVEKNTQKKQERK